MTLEPGSIVVPTNEFQTPVTGEFLSGMDEWARGEFMSCLESIPYVKWLIAPDRPRAKDLPRDGRGRIIVDIAHPHVLEDVDYFRPSAKFFEENGCYTFLRPNRNPRSEYGRWLAEEWRRCLDGYVRESDGEWVTGYMYWFLNYCRIMKTEVDPVSGVASRVEGFPEFWEGIYYRFHYMEQARRAGKHCIELSRRGAGKSYSFAAVLSHNLILGENMATHKTGNVMTALLAYSKEYLLVSKDGTLKKFVTTKDFVAANTGFPRLMLKSSPSEMSWEAGYLNANGNRCGSGNTVIGVSIKDDESKIRGKRGIFLFEEMGSFSSLLSTYDNVRDSVKDGQNVFGQIYLLGTAGDAESDFSGAKTMLYAPDKYDILSVENVYDRAGDGGERFGYFFPSYVSRNGRIGVDGNSDVTAALRDVLENRARLRDGNSATYLSVVAQQPITPSEAILRVKSSFFDVPLITERLRQLDTDPRAHDDEWVGDLIETQDGVTFRPNGDIPIRQWPSPGGNIDPGALVIWEMPQKGPDGKPVANRYIIGCLTPGNMVDTERGLVPVEDVTINDRLLNKDGEFVRIRNLQRREKHEETVYDIRLCSMLGATELTGNHPVYCATPERHYRSWKSKKPEEPAVYYKYDFEFREARLLKKGDVVKSPVRYNAEEDIDMSLWDDTEVRIDRRIRNPLDDVKFWWIVGLMLGNGYCDTYTVHLSFNSKDSQYIERFVEYVNDVFGKTPYVAHDRGSCIELCFNSKQFSEFFTKWFGRYAYGKNIPEWAKRMPKRLRVALLHGYLDSDGCGMECGVEFVSISRKLLSDVQQMLLSVGVISSLKRLRGASEHHIEGRVCKTRETFGLSIGMAASSVFRDLIGMEDIRLSRVRFDCAANHNIRRIWLSDDGKYVYYKVASISERMYTGTVYNFECDTHTYMCDGLPVHNCDPYDNDRADSDSLFSAFMFDLFTDRIVAEYTGRKPFAEECYELVYRMCLFYNATCLYESNKKMMFSYFSKRRALWMLADCPEYLRDRQLVKYSMWGSSAKGVSVNAAINSFAIDLIRDWLKKPYTVEVEENGQKVPREVPNAFAIRSYPLLQELAGYDPGKNTDRVSALAQVMLYREQFIVLYGGSPSAGDDDGDDPAASEFFDHDWKRHLMRLESRGF